MKEIDTHPKFARAFELHAKILVLGNMFRETVGVPAAELHTMESIGAAKSFRRRVLEEVDTAKREAKDATDLLRGTIILGVLPTIAPYLLPEAITEYLEKYPRVEIVAQEDTTAHLLKLLVACEIDFALASPGNEP